MTPSFTDEYPKRIKVLLSGTVISKRSDCNVNSRCRKGSSLVDKIALGESAHSLERCVQYPAPAVCTGTQIKASNWKQVTPETKIERVG